MNTTHTRNKLVAAAVGAVVAVATPALLLLGVGTAQATQDVDPANPLQPNPTVQKDPAGQPTKLPVTTVPPPPKPKIKITLQLKP